MKKKKGIKISTADPNDNTSHGDSFVTQQTALRDITQDVANSHTTI